MPTALIRAGTLYAWKGASLLIVDTDGRCGEPESLTGYYFREARFLRTLRLEVNGESPWLCEATRVDPSTLAFTYAHPEIAPFGGDPTGDAPPTDHRGITQRALAVRLTYRVGLDGLRATLVVTNHAKQDVDCEVAWAVDADFADIQEAHARTREQYADVAAAVDRATLTLAYQHPKLRYRASIAVTGNTAWSGASGRLATQTRLRPQTAVTAELVLTANDADGLTASTDVDARVRRLDAWRDSFATMTAPHNRVAEQIVACNLRDFASFPLLEGPADEWLTLQAGMPMYPALFGRDTLTAGWQAAWVDRGQTLEASLTRLGRLQSDCVDDWRDAEPGRIPYQVRRGPLALLDINPYAAYYADYASPFMFVIALAHLFSWTGDADAVRRHWATARRILDWAQRDGDKNGDGYLEYRTRSKKGTKNQGWKDSGDAIIYPDGSAVPAPLGTCELQGYWFAAQQAMAVLSWIVGNRREARAYWRSAMSLKTRFNQDWWIDDEQCVALAMDPAGRIVPGVSSNIGHCIASGIIDAAHLPVTVERLFAPDMFSGWGVRTLSSEHQAYSPLSYHCGSVWAVEQATIAFGLRRFGFDGRALELSKALFDLAEQYPAYRIPETVGGYPRAEHATPGAYPIANTPQLWNATAFALLIHTILGLQPVAPLRLLVVAPALPSWLDEVVLHDVRLGDAVATIRFWREKDGASHARIVRKRGTMRLVEQPPPESLAAGIGDRFSALVHTVLH